MTSRTPAETRAGVGMAWRKKGAANEIATTAVTSAKASLVFLRASAGELVPMVNRWCCVAGRLPYREEKTSNMASILSLSASLYTRTRMNFLFSVCTCSTPPRSSDGRLDLKDESRGCCMMA